MKTQLHTIASLSWKFILCTGLLVSGLTGCKEKAETGVAVKSSAYVRDAALLLEYFGKNGNPVNQAEKAGVDAADLVYRFTDNTAVVDLRSHTDYLRLHIPGSVNIPFDKLYFAYLQRNQAFRYREIVFVCADGQQSAYAAALFRMAGVAHASYLEGGISSWNSALPQPTYPGITPGGDAVSSTTGTVHSLPLIPSSVLRRDEMVQDRIRTLFREGLFKFSTRTSEQLPAKAKVQYVCYGTTADFAAYHPGNSLLIDITKGITTKNDLEVLDPSAPILVYGQHAGHAAYLTACLRLLGYQATYLSGGMLSLNNAPDGLKALKVSAHRFPLVGFLAAEYPGSVPAQQNTRGSGSSDPSKAPKQVILKPVNNPAPEGC